MLKDYEVTYEKFWKPFLEVNEVMDIDKVKRELHDYRVVLFEVAKVYQEVTLGKFSKPNTRAQVIIDIVNERIEQAR